MTKMNLKTNNVSKSTKYSVLLPSKYDTFAAIEFKFREVFFKYLILSNFSNEVSHGEYVINKVSNLRRHLNETNSNKKFPSSYSKSTFIKRRPDFIIHSVGLVIEIDGVVHDTEKGVKKDYLRLEEYRSLGYEVIVFENRKIANSKTRNLLIKELMELLLQLSVDVNLNKRLEKIKYTQSKYRSDYLAKTALVECPEKQSQYLNCLSCIRRNGGYRYIFDNESELYKAERLKYLQYSSPHLNFNP